MSTINREQLVSQLNWRYATKQFDPGRKISPEDWAALEESVVLSPSSFGLQPWKFVVVTDPFVKEKLVPASFGQHKVAECSHFVVFAIKKDLNEADIDRFIDRIAEVRGVARESLKGFREVMVGSLIKGLDVAARNAWCARQAYIALGNLLNSAALLGIDACPMEGIEPEKHNAILGLDRQGLTAVVACALGYRAVSDEYALAKKVRFPKEQVMVAV
jgi:nitroreductase